MKISTIMLLASIGIVFLVIIIWLIGKKVFKEKRISSKFQIKNYLQMILASILVALAITFLNPNNWGNIVIYFVVLFMMPYVYLSNQKRKQDEHLFSELILLCNNMATLLKQNHNAYLSLSIAQKDVTNDLKNDVDELLKVLQEDKKESAIVYEQFAQKYNYTIIKQLNVLILQIHYENNTNIDKVIDLFQDDVERLMLDVKENQVKRKMLRIQYIGLSIGCVCGEWYLVNNLQQSIKGAASFYGTMSIVYIIAVLICLFFVDQYFNNHITKE